MAANKNRKKAGSELVIILVTAPDNKTARKLAMAALQRHLIACANLIPAIESHYWWKDKIEQGREVLLLLKTTRQKVSELERLILKLHPYDTPEFVALDPTTVTKRYFDWARSAVSNA